MGDGAAFRRVMRPGEGGVKGESEVGRSGDSRVLGGVRGRVGDGEVSIWMERLFEGRSRSGDAGGEEGGRIAE